MASSEPEPKNPWLKDDNSPVNQTMASVNGVGEEMEDQAQFVYGLRLAAVIVSLISIALLIMLDMSIIATATPNITSEFHSVDDVGWYGTAYLITSCALQPMSGKLFARFNIKYTYLAFFGLFEVGSLICATSTSSSMFIVGRAIAGMGSSGVGNGATTILSASIPLAKRPTYFGIVGSCIFFASCVFLVSTLISAGGQIGVVISPLIGGALTQYISWRWCFYINLPVGGLAVAALIFVPLPKYSLRRAETTVKTLASLFHDLDIVGFLLFSPAVIMFLLALEWGGSTYLWDSAIVIGLFCGSAGNIALFLAWEYNKGLSAMIPFELIRKRAIFCSCLTLFFLYANSLITSYYLAIYFQGVRNKSPTLSGVFMLPGIIGQMIAGILNGLAVSRLGYYLPSTVIGAALAAVGSGLMSTFTLSTRTGTWIGYQIIAGVGRGCALQMPLIAIQNNIPASEIAVSMAIAYFCQNFGGALWISFAETVLNTGLQNSLPKYAPGVSAAQVISAGVSGIRSSVSIPRASVQGVVMAYNNSVQHVFYMVSGTAAAAFVLSWGLGWGSVKKPERSTET